MFETTAIKERDITKKVSLAGERIVLRPFVDGKRGYLLVKRTIDIIISLLVVLCVFSWLFPILFILIKLDSRGPVFFVQKRVGFLGKSFYCLKFRTMHVNPEANARQATDNDPRITRLGKFLRNSNLDEVPQFLNVLWGDMSIVGPRPHMHNDCLHFSQHIATYKFRNLMKPGITGLSQVKGYRGPAMDFERIFKRYQWDAFYVRNANFWLDMRIIHETAMQTFKFLVRFFVPAEENQTLLGHNELTAPVKNLLN